jgi:hypothetical protein
MVASVAEKASATPQRPDQGLEFSNAPISGAESSAFG